MELTKFIAVIILIALTEITATTDQNIKVTTGSADKENFNPLESLVLNQNGDSESTKDGSARLVRVKRQYYPDPYYGRGPYYPIPFPIFLGGFGGGPGFGRGFGGRGFGGRGIGGRGIGGRGIGGFGGRGVGGIGGGHGGGGGRG